MADKVNLPGIGEVDKRYVWAGVAIVGGIVGFAWWRRLQSGGNAGPVVDPATGSIDGGGGYVNPAPGGGSADGPIDQGASEVIDTNHEWANDVATRLSSSWEPTFVLTVLGKYLAGIALTPQEADVARAAIAIAGPPPDGAPPITIVRTTQPAPPPKTTPPPAPPPSAPKTPTLEWFGRQVTYSTYTSQPGDTWPIVDAKFTAVGDWNLWKFNQNGGYALPRESQIPPGTVVKIPNEPAPWQLGL